MPAMKWVSSSSAKVLCVLLVLTAAHLSLPAFVPQAHALYFEDDVDSNPPEDRVERPKGGFFLFKWIHSLTHSSTRREAAALENRDKGPGVNGGRKAVVLVTSGIVGMAIGLGISSSIKNPGNRARSNFIGGSLGLCGGFGIGALIMPGDYQVDPQALGEYHYRVALLDDPAQSKTQAAFRRTTPLASLIF